MKTDRHPSNSGRYGDFVDEDAPELNSVHLGNLAVVRESNDKFLIDDGLRVISVSRQRAYRLVMALQLALDIDDGFDVSVREKK